MKHIKSDRLVLSIEPGTVQTWTGTVDPAWKFKCTTASRERGIKRENREFLKSLKLRFSKIINTLNYRTFHCSFFVLSSKGIKKKKREF